VATDGIFFVISVNYRGNLGCEVSRCTDEAGKAGFFSCVGSFPL
jgi:hypothetical protein